MGSLLVASLILSLAVLKAFSISLPAIVNVFSISSPILEKASLKSSHGVDMPASTPILVLTPHLGQKYDFSGSSSPQLEQYVITISLHNEKWWVDLSLYSIDVVFS